MKYKRLLDILLLIGVFLFLPCKTWSQADEYMMKAGFLEKITRFVNWPTDSIKSDSTSPFIITVIGKNPFDDKLDTFFSTTKIKKRKVVVRYISSVEELNVAHVLFISQSEQRNLDHILDITRNKPIITVGETNGFAEKGVMINFYLESNRIRLEINKNTVSGSGLQVSHLLLNAARII